jgi:nitrite reductase/ring-hydroxylating ferredoxin subunit
MLNYCVHQSGPLCEGKLEGTHSYSMGDEEEWEWTYDDETRIVSCPWHHWRFDIDTGRSIEHDEYAVPTFDVEVSDGDILIAT